MSLPPLSPGTKGEQLGPQEEGEAAPRKSHSCILNTPGSEIKAARETCQSAAPDLNQCHQQNLPKIFHRAPQSPSPCHQQPIFGQLLCAPLTEGFRDFLLKKTIFCFEGGFQLVLNILM